MLLPLHIKSLTNNTELITCISRLGHGVSYTKLSEISTETAYDTVENNTRDDVWLPENVKPMAFTMIIEDNIDRNEQTLSGYGTTHKVNSIMIQPGTYNDQR